MGEGEGNMLIKTGLMWKMVIPAILVGTVMVMTACTDANLPENTTEEDQAAPAAPEVPKTPEDQEEIADNSFETYFSYLNVSREKLKNDLGTSTEIDEGGLAFKDADIRVWFENDEKTAKSISVWIGNPDVDYNGIKRGESINRFREEFGVPLSDNTASAEAIFVYEQVWLIVDYDPGTGKTVGVYLSSPTNPNFINPVTETTAEEIQNTLGITLKIPGDAQDIEYTMIDSGDGKVIAQAMFKENGMAYTYRVRPATALEDISGAYYDWNTIKEMEVSYCSGEIRYNEGKQGIILWYDVVPGLMYSVFTNEGASEESLLSIANKLYVPAKDVP